MNSLRWLRFIMPHPGDWQQKCEGGTSFADAVASITTDQEWRNDVIETIKRQNTRGNGADRDKGKGKRKFVDIPADVPQPPNNWVRDRGNRPFKEKNAQALKTSNKGPMLFQKGWHPITQDRQAVCIRFNYGTCPEGSNCTNMSLCAIAALRAGTIIETNTHCLAVLCNRLPTFLE